MLKEKVFEMVDPKNRSVNNPHIIIEDVYAKEYLRILVFEIDNIDASVDDFDFADETVVNSFIQEMKKRKWSKVTRVDNCFLLGADVVLR